MSDFESDLKCTESCSDDDGVNSEMTVGPTVGSTYKDVLLTPPSKKKRHLVRFSDKWQAEFVWLHAVREDIYQAYCTLCKKPFSIGHSGKGDIAQHARIACHLKAQTAAGSKQINNYFVRTVPTAIDLMVGNHSNFRL
jgi:hypothetical protein